MTGTEQLLHGTCVALDGRAALLRGRSGAGKSDLALRFLSAFRGEGAALVADDQVLVRQEAGALVALPPPAIAGRLEVRGVGVVAVPWCPQAGLFLLVDLVAPKSVPRLPLDPAEEETLLGVALSRIALAPFETSAAVKLKIALAGGL